jgi:hypothetical protein
MIASADSLQEARPSSILLWVYKEPTEPRTTGISNQYALMFLLVGWLVANVSKVAQVGEIYAQQVNLAFVAAQWAAGLPERLGELIKRGCSVLVPSPSAPPRETHDNTQEDILAFIRESIRLMEERNRDAMHPPAAIMDAKEEPKSEMRETLAEVRSEQGDTGGFDDDLQEGVSEASSHVAETSVFESVCLTCA